MKIVDLIGQRFTRLIVVEKNDIRKNGRVVWKCRCDCNNVTYVITSNLTMGLTKSCGCLRKENNKIIAKNKKHGHCIGGISGTHVSWNHMKQRCLNPNNHAYHLYGGRGITIIDRWINSFENFLKDMGERPENTSIDRINNDGNYEPGNCRWADMKTQSNNRRKSTMC